jgi:hypothetical protein
MIEFVTLQIVRDFVAIFGVIAGFSYYVLKEESGAILYG